MDIITRLEEAILIAIWRLQDNAYGVPINKQVSQSSDKKYTIGALYYSFDQLLRKGYVSKIMKSNYDDSVGRNRTYYVLTAKGKRALQEARAYQRSLWKGIPEIAFASKKVK
jgi:DNA-binding PadR family transcriptional regulator